jgi:hypothetical protein
MTLRQLDLIVHDCAMQLLSHCNPLYHDSRVMVAEVERIFAWRIMEDREESVRTWPGSTAR